LKSKHLLWVAKLVIQPTALHWTSTLDDFINWINGSRPPSWTINNLFGTVKIKTKKQKQKKFYS